MPLFHKIIIRDRIKIMFEAVHWGNTKLKATGMRIRFAMDWQSIGNIIRTERRQMCIEYAKSRMVTAFLLLLIVFLAAIQPSYADEVDDALAHYEELQARVSSLQDEIDDMANRIGETEDKIEHTNLALENETQRNYRSIFADDGASNPLAIVLGGGKIEDVLAGLMYSTKLSDASSNTIDELTRLEDDLASQSAELSERMVDAQADANEAQRLYKEAQERQEAAREAAEAEARAAYAIENTASSLPDVDWRLTEDEFVAEWAPRINSYLDGYPLAGYGDDFARAAYRYGVDPRWSPAISCIESTKGLYCFASHNAWGYLGQSYSSWSEAIWDHVEYLSCDYYHGQCTLQAAHTYCPPTYIEWYNLCISEMSRI